MSETLPSYTVRRVAPFAACAEVGAAPWRDLHTLSDLVAPAGVDPPAKATTVKACHDGRSLHVLFHCEDPDVRATLRHRDAHLWEESAVEMFISPTCSVERYFELQVNAIGTIFDARITNPGGARGKGFAFDPNWDCPGLTVTPAGSGRFNGTADRDAWWAVHVAIPFDSLDASGPSDGDRWRANFYRIEQSGRALAASWSPLPKLDFHQAHRFGELVFVD